MKKSIIQITGTYIQPAERLVTQLNNLGVRFVTGGGPVLVAPLPAADLLAELSCTTFKLFSPRPTVMAPIFMLLAATIIAAVLPFCLLGHTNNIFVVACPISDPIFG